MRGWRMLAVVAGLMLAMNGAARADWRDDADAAHARGDSQTEFSILRPHAEQGDARAQFLLGFLHEIGQGVAQDYKTAVKWYTKSAEQGHASAQHILGEMYANGQGVVQDYKIAVKWTTKAAEQGDSRAQFNLGVAYKNGQGVAQDYKTAIRWYIKSAEQGHAGAQNNIGVMYEIGQGVAQDYIKAHMWYNISAIDGTTKQAAKNRDQVAAKMTPDAIAKAQELASKCIAKNYKNCGF